MKNILKNVTVAFVALALTFATVSCKKNKNDDPTPNNPSENVAPTVSATAAPASPTAPADVTITAIASDADGTVSKVQFIKNGSVEFEDVSSPYQYFISGVTAGTYTYTVKAIDNNGASTTTTVNFTVNANNGGTNHAPTINISNKLVASDGSAKTFTLPVSDSDGNTVTISGAITSSNNNVTATYDGLEVTVSVPNAVFAGTTTLTITVTDGTTPTTATVTVNVGENAQITTYNILSSKFNTNLSAVNIQGTINFNSSTKNVTTSVPQSGGFYGTSSNSGTFVINDSGYLVVTGNPQMTYSVTTDNSSYILLSNINDGTKTYTFAY